MKRREGELAGEGGKELCTQFNGDYDLSHLGSRGNNRWALRAGLAREPGFLRRASKQASSSGP